MTQKERYRVFISYSREDADLVKQVVEVLEENGLHPMCDKSFACGGGFPEQIKKFIAYSHVFAPIITEESSKRGWVHQEIGFATALNIPVLPICQGTLPGEMIRELQAVFMDEGPESIKDRLSEKTIDNLIRRAHKGSRALYESAEYHEDRTMMMADHAEDILGLGEFGHVRQKGALSSFHIPDSPVSNPIWKKRYGNYEPSIFRCRLLRKERKVLEAHAREKGCSLIVDPSLSFDLYGVEARQVRLTILRDFIKSMPADKITIAINRGMDKSHNWTFVGNWFFAESVSGALRKGYTQTIFTRHAPTVQERMELFDNEIDELLSSRKIKAENSADHVIAEIDKILTELENASINSEEK